MILSIVAFIFVLGILVIVHEAGHFFMAKLSGVKVEEFAIGFPPRIISFKRHETRYTIGLLPLGGYVKMLGEEEVSKDPRSFGKQKPGKRFLISIAGVVMNLVLAWIILSVGFAVGMSSLVSDPSSIPGKTISSKVLITDITKDSPAQTIGLEPGDFIKSASVDGVEYQFGTINAFDQFSADNFGKNISLIIDRDGNLITKTVQMSKNKDEALGVSISDQTIVKVAWYMAPVIALRETFYIVKATFVFFQDFFHQLFVARTVSSDVGGPVAIYVFTGMAAKAGWMVLWQFIALLSVNLAFINILPFPALDGGRAVFIVLEKIFRKRIVKEEIENIIHVVGLATLLILVLLVTYRDILRYIIK